MDYWNKIEITKKNFNKAAFEILGMAVWGYPEFPKCNAKFTLEEGYNEGCGFKQRDNPRANWANLITSIDDEKLKKQLWKKFLLIVRKLYKIHNNTKLLTVSGDLELLYSETKKIIKHSKDWTNICINEISSLAYNIGLHKNKFEFLKNPEQLIQAVEELIIYVVELATSEELENNYWELERCIGFYLANEKSIPSQLKGAAQYILNKNKEKLEYEREEFEKLEKKLKQYNTAIRRALRTKKG